MIIQCPKCSGRGWMPWVHPTIRMYVRSQRVVELTTVRNYVYKDACPRCHGSGKTLLEQRRKHVRRK